MNKKAEKYIADQPVTAPSVEQPVKADEFDFDTFECKTIADVELWNMHARKAHRKARLTDKHAQPPYAIKVPTGDMHPQATVKFQRFDQPQNVLKMRVRNKDIDWKGQLKPGRRYTLPVPVIKFLNDLSYPIYGEVNVDDGGETIKETRVIGETNRFSCQVQF